MGHLLLPSGGRGHRARAARGVCEAPRMPSAVARALDRALEALVPHLDVVAVRADDGVVPAWSDARGWTAFLLSLSDDDLARCETAGLAAVALTLPGAPPSLSALAAAAADLALALPRLAVALPALPPPWLRSVPARKRLQLAALLAAVAPLAARAARIVDVGAGSGHFTRIAADLFATDAVGLELRPDRVAFATARAAASASASVSGSAPAPASASAPASVSVSVSALGGEGFEQGGGEAGRRE